MFTVAKEDVLKGLKKFKRLAKQDLLVSQLTAEPEFWSAQAEERRNVYTQLMDLINEHGVEHAYDFAMHKYAGLLFLLSDNQQTDPLVSGRRQALEMFFTILGQNPEQIQAQIPTKIAKEGDMAASAQS